MEVQILELDEPNANGHIYTTDAVLNWLVGLDDTTVYGTIGMSDYMANGSIPLDRISHQITNLCIKDGKLVGTLTVLDTPLGQALSKLPEQDYAIACVGNITENGEVVDISVVSVNAIAPGTKA